MSLKWGIVAAGLISQDFCAALRTLSHDDHQIIAIAARNGNEAKRVAEKYSIKYYYDSYDKIYENNEINIVYVGTVNNTHKEACLKAIQHGKHVLCEKPMSMNSNDQEEVLKLAKEKGVFFMEAIWSRFFPAMERLRQELKAETIGEVRIVQANFFVNNRHVDRVRLKELGGGGLLDLGIYPIQFALFAFNHEVPTEIVATGHLMSTGVDECVNITLKYPNQRLAVITISTNCGFLGSGIIAGEKGTIQIPKFLWCPTELVLANGERLEFPIENSENVKTNFDYSVGLRYQAEAIRKAINEGLKEHPYVSHSNSRLIMKIMDETRKQIGYTQ